MIYHSGPEEPLRHDFNLMVNVFGYGSCYMQTHPLSHLFSSRASPCRNWLHDGHHMMEVYYGGGWHCLDPHMTFYVLQPRHSPAHRQCGRAEGTPRWPGCRPAEHRTGPAFLICGDAPTWFSGETGWMLDHPFPPPRRRGRDFGGIQLRRGERFVRTWKAG